MVEFLNAHWKSQNQNLSSLSLSLSPQLYGVLLRKIIFRVLSLSWHQPQMRMGHMHLGQKYLLLSNYMQGVLK